MPERLGRYRILEELGRGMMGVVYRAEDPMLGRNVALKTIVAALAMPVAERKGFEIRFLTEARAAAKLSHPGIVAVYDAGRDEATEALFIVFEYLEGRPLADSPAGGAALKPDEALRIAAAVAEALHHAHSKGVVHRDIKPANVMMLPSGQPRIMDFGIAKLGSLELTRAGVIHGTPRFMSPEQALGLPVDPRTDIFSLGSTLFLLLTGNGAFDAGTLPALATRIAQGEPQRPSALVSGLPRGTDEVVMRALAKDPGDRYQDAQAFADDLNRLRSGEYRPRAVGTGRGTVLPRPAAADRQGGWRRTWLPGAIALVLVAGGLWLTRSDEPEPDRLTPVAPSTEGPSPPTPILEPSAKPAATASVLLELAVEEAVRGGTLEVWIDDELSLQTPISGRSGRFRLDVSPGTHELLVSLKTSRDQWRDRIRVNVRAGEAQPIQARQVGLPGQGDAALVLLPLAKKANDTEPPPDVQ